MTPRTLPPAPTDRGMWRRLLKLVHPDRGGDGDLFVWTRSLYEHVAGDAPEDERTYAQKREPPRHHAPSSEGDRLDFTDAHVEQESFADLTARAVAMAEKSDPIFGDLLSMLRSCYEAQDGPLFKMQNQGATYRALAFAAHLAGMSDAERSRWYRIAEAVPLSQRHVGHIIKELQARS